jgi:hypothetical protein
MQFQRYLLNIRITKGKILATESKLKNLGIKNESIEYLANLSKSPKGLFQYSRWKKTQIDDLRKNKAYYEKLVKEGTDESLKPTEELENVTKRLQEVESFYKRIDKLYQKFVKDPKNEELQDTIRAEVIFEETDETQRERFKEEKIKQVKEFEEQNQTKAKLEEEEIDLNKPDSKTAEQILDLNEEADHNKPPQIVSEESVPEPTIRKNSWMNKYTEGETLVHNKQSFIIQAKTEDGLIVKDLSGAEYLVTKEKDKLKFTSSIGEMGVSETPTPVEPAEEIPFPEEPLTDSSKEPIEIIEPLEQPSIEQITEPKAQELTLGTEEFTWEQIFNQSNSVWVPVSSGLNSNFVYSKEGCSKGSIISIGSLELSVRGSSGKGISSAGSTGVGVSLTPISPILEVNLSLSFSLVTKYSAPLKSLTISPSSVFAWIIKDCLL